MPFDDMERLIERQRSKSHMKSFAYMTICGLTLIIGGGTFFLYESIITGQNHRSLSTASNEDELTEDQNMDMEKDDKIYAGEFKYAAISFVSVGCLLLLLGTPLAYTHYRRMTYLSMIEDESPIRKKINHSNKRNLKTELPDNEKKLYSPKSLSWFWQKKATGDEFRLGINHHPSFNLVPIEELAGLSHWSPGRSYRHRTSIKEVKSSMSDIIRKFFNFSRSATNNDDDHAHKIDVTDDVNNMDEHYEFHIVDKGVSNPCCSDAPPCESDNDDDSLVAYGGDVSSVYEDDR